ncbi:MAG TPA: hypothetical protein VFQ81_11620 [Candidatus Limnocylindria bacterium]|nr:hypothetical protein [Candidatus Limnocylindria bacterium]
MSAAVHRVPLPPGAEPTVDVGDEVSADAVLAVRRALEPPIAVPAAQALRRPPAEVPARLVVMPGERVAAGDPLAAAGHRIVRSPVSGLFLTVARTDGSLLVAPLGEEVPVVGHVAGRVRAVERRSISIEVPGAVLRGIAGSGEAVHGELVVAVHEPGEELRAAAIDVAKAGRIVVGGSRASAETLIRARAMGVAGIVLGGVLDKELRDFESIQRRRREMGGMTGAFALILVEGFGKVGFDPPLFEWFRRQSGRMASLIGAERVLYVHEADPPPERRPLPLVGGQVVAHRRPFQGRSGALVAILDDLHAAPSGIPARMALVRFDDGRLAPVPLANLEAVAEPS